MKQSIIDTYNRIHSGDIPFYIQADDFLYLYDELESARVECASLLEAIDPTLHKLGTVSGMVSQINNAYAGLRDARAYLTGMVVETKENAR